LYKEGDHADEIYFIQRGRLNFVIAESPFFYKTFLKGSYVGEIELIFEYLRLDNVQAIGQTELLVISRSDFLPIFEEFPEDSR
jgi:CRP-like cAMP-binding protein